MKKLIHKLRLWLLGLLKGVPEECEAASEEVFLDYIKQQKTRISVLENAVREICRCGDHGYYDWCCEYCTAECDKRNGWCRRFKA